MKLPLNKVLAKLDRPPAGHNWARLVDDSVAATTKSIVAFAKGMPKFNYQTGTSAVRDRLLFGIGEDSAVSVTRRSGAPAGRSQNEELVRAFFEYDATRRYPIGTCIEFERQWFRISREILVPVSPLVIVREKGRFVPIFLCGWSELALNEAQRRLLMTIYDDAFLSLTDFQDSPAEFLFFPKTKDRDGKKRQPEVWGRSDYRLLTPRELQEQVEIYLEARSQAQLFLIAEDKREREVDVAAPEPTQAPIQPDLFLHNPEDK